MTFDNTKFMKEQFKSRTKKIDVPELATFFGKGKAVWEVRGLTGAEVAIANEALEKNKTMAIVAEALAGTRDEKVEGFKELFGVSADAVPEELVRRKEMLSMASVAPVCTEDLAVKLADAFPTVFFSLTTEIIKLTGLGKTPGKPKASGKKQTSETA